MPRKFSFAPFVEFGYTFLVDGANIPEASLKRISDLSMGLAQKVSALNKDYPLVEFNATYSSRVSGQTYSEINLWSPEKIEFRRNKRIVPYTTTQTIIEPHFDSLGISIQQPADFGVNLTPSDEDRARRTKEVARLNSQALKSIEEIFQSLGLPDVLESPFWDDSFGKSFFKKFLPLVDKANKSIFDLSNGSRLAVVPKERSDNRYFDFIKGKYLEA